MNRWLALAWLLVIAAALALRLPGLERRPLHNDEAVNAILLQRLWEQGEYRYNPDEYHGPTLIYGALAAVRLGRVPDFDRLPENVLRWVTVAAGLAVVLGVWWLRDALGPCGTVVASLGAAVSPAMVFYSRYFIHEMLLVAFSLLLLVAAWRYRQRPGAVWAALGGAALGLMYATKETFVITLAAWGVAGLAVAARQRNPAETTTTRGTADSAGRRHLVMAAVVAAAVSLTLFTSFFTHARGPIDSVATYFPWLRRAGGHSPHLHPWTFYLERLFWFRPARGPWWSEAFLGLLALVGLGAAFTGRGLRAVAMPPETARFLAIYTVFLTAAYSLIPYKTPWCLLNFLLPVILLAGLGAAVLLGAAHSRTRRTLLAAALVAGFTHLGWQSWQASHTRETQRGHPYAYSPTVPNAVELADRVKAIAHAGTNGVRTDVRVVAPASDYWPLPWYLRQLRSVGWLDTLPAPPYPPILVVAARVGAALDDKTERRWLGVGYYELRPGEFFELFVEYELWKRYLETRPRPKDDE